MSVSTQINIHGTDPEIYDALARVFDPDSAEDSEWIKIMADGVTLVFFKQKEPVEVVSE